MARTRSTRPDDFLDDVLGAEDFPVEGHFLRFGMNCLADKEGRLEDKPLKIRAQIFPYRTSINVDQLLERLQAVGSIIRYSAGGMRLIQLVGFVEQQNPHPNEAKSKLPGPPVQSAGSVTPAHVISGSIPERSASIQEASEASPPSPSDPGSLITDPGSQSPDPGGDDVGEPEDAAGDDEAESSGPRPEALRDLWNRMASKYDLPMWNAMSKRRRTAARGVLKACPDLDRWERFLDYTLAQPFYQGKEGGRGWRADVDWLLRSKTPDQVLDFDGQLPLAPVAQVVPINSRHQPRGADVPNVPSFRGGTLTPPGEG